MKLAIIGPTLTLRYANADGALYAQAAIGAWMLAVQRRRLLARLEKIDPVALARAISQVEMVRIALAHLAGPLLPAA